MYKASNEKNAALGRTRTALSTALDSAYRTPPATTGQIGQVYGLIKNHPGIWSLTMTADHAIPEAAARVHDLRSMGFNIITTIHPVVLFRGVERRNVASYSIGTPEWQSPEFRLQENVPVQSEMDLFGEGEV